MHVGADNSALPSRTQSTYCHPPLNQSAHSLSSGNVSALPCATPYAGIVGMLQTLEVVLLQCVL